jgi:hypothetical protein
MSVDVARVPLADPRPLRVLLRRGRILRLVLAILLVAAAVLAIAEATRLRAQPAPVALPNTSAILVVDLSSSITSDVYRQIEHTLHTAARSGARYGLVFFSDVAYEALPPGSPGDELHPYRRFFTPVMPELRPGSPSPTAGELTFPASPWATSFSGGTRISTGLALALGILQREQVADPSVTLVSDLADDASDVPRLGAVLGQYDLLRIPLRIVALSPGAQDRALFQSLLSGNGEIEEAPTPPRSAAAPLIPVGETGSPRVLMALAAALLVALALNELALGRLTWRAKR